MNRRTFLSAVALAPLAACGTGATGALTPATVIDDANAILTGIGSLLAAPQITALIPPTTLAQVQGWITAAHDRMAAVTAGMPAAQGATALQTVEGYVNDALNVLAGFPLIPPPYSVFLQAAAVLLPVVEAFVGTVLPPAPAPAKARLAALRARSVTMTEDQARVILRGAPDAARAAMPAPPLKPTRVRP